MIVNEVGLGGNQYFSAIGTGLEYDQVVWDDLAVKSVFEFRQKNYHATPPTGRCRPASTAATSSSRCRCCKPITTNSALNLEFDYLNQYTTLPFYTNTTYAIGGSYRIRYDDPTGLTSMPWETHALRRPRLELLRGARPVLQHQRQPAVPGLSTQLTQRWRFGITQTFQVSRNIAIVLQVQRDIVSSNLPLYAYTNNSVLLGPQINF